MFVQLYRPGWLSAVDMWPKISDRSDLRICWRWLSTAAIKISILLEDVKPPLWVTVRRKLEQFTQTRESVVAVFWGFHTVLHEERSGKEPGQSAAYLATRDASAAQGSGFHGNR